MTEEFVIALVTIVVNVFLVFFVWRETRHIYRPVLTTKIISEGKLIDSRPGLVERGPSYYLVISNISTNTASRIRVIYRFVIGEKSEIEVTKNLEYLNPQEAAELLLESNRIFQGNPKLFHKVHRGKITKVIPIENLKLALNVEILSGSRVGGHRLRDSYYLEWLSMKSCPRFNDHPVIRSWNRRSNLFIHKLVESEKAANDSKRISHKRDFKAL